MKYFRAISLFCKIVWREWEPKSCGIPEPYRSHYRISPYVAAWVAWIVCVKYSKQAKARDQAYRRYCDEEVSD